MARWFANAYATLLANRRTIRIATARMAVSERQAGPLRASSGRGSTPSSETSDAFYSAVADPQASSPAVSDHVEDATTMVATESEWGADEWDGDEWDGDELDELDELYSAAPASSQIGSALSGSEVSEPGSDPDSAAPAHPQIGPTLPRSASRWNPESDLVVEWVSSQQRQAVGYG
jgi:hypothetical protein